ncbi:MAG: EI24 domain-containing protein [Pseudomonadota bacterium]
MVSAALKALEQMFSPPFRVVLFKSLGMTVLLFIAVGIAVQFGLTAISFSSIAWLDLTASVVAGFGALIIMLVAGFFLIGPVTALFAGIFLDDIAEKVEEKHYSGDRPGTAVPLGPSLFTALQFALVILLVHLTMLPFLIFGLGALGMVIGNAYLLGREYFTMTGMRHLPPEEARAMRKRNAGRVFAAGIIPAFLAFVPLGNLIMPLFTTAYMTHIFKRVQRDEEEAWAAARA